MMDQEERAALLESLASPEPDERRAVLLVLAEDPTGDAHIRAAVEVLLEDRSVCQAQPPAALAEVRWYAAHALAAERRAAGIPEPVRVSPVVPPQFLDTLMELGEAAYGDARLPRSEVDLFEKLRADGRLPTVELNL